MNKAGAELIRAAGNIDDLRYRIHCASELVRCVFVAITQGDCEPCNDDYDALFGAYSYLSSLDTELKKASEHLWRSLPVSNKETA
jgi:hypothetical protein